MTSAQGARSPRATTTRRALLVLLVGGAAPGLALDPLRAPSQYTRGTIESRDGLPQSSVLAVAQDREGYLWFGTQDGLARFDGVTLRVLDARRTPGFPHNVVTALTTDSTGRLWVATAGGGLAWDDAGTFRNLSTRGGLGSDRAWSLAGTPDGTVWVGTSGGLDRVRDGRVERVLATATDALGGKVATLIVRRDGSLWAGTSGGGLVHVRDGRVARRLTSAEGLADDRVAALAEDAEGNLWVGTFGGLSRMRNGNPEAVRLSREKEPPVTALLTDRDGNLWVGTKGAGLFRLGAVGAAPVPGFSDATIRSLYEDAEGNLWVGTAASGAVRLSDGKFASLSESSGLGAMPCAVRETRNGTTWIGTEGAGLLRLAGGRAVPASADGKLLGGGVCALAEDPAGSLWAGTTDGRLLRFAGGGFREVGRGAGLPADAILCLLPSRDGALLVGTRFAGLFSVRDGVATPLGLSEHAVHALLEEPDGTIWAATNGGGLLRLRAGRTDRFDSKSGLASDVVFALHRAADGTVWVGTGGGGLCSISGGTARCLGTPEGLFDDTVFAVLSDGSGNLWMSGNRGVFRAPERELSAVAAGRSRALSCVGFDTDDGLPAREGVGGYGSAALASRDGRLWFSTLKGLASVDPARLRANPVPPPVHVEAVLAGREPVPSTTGPARLPLEARRRLEIAYSACSFVAPRRVRFRYRLEGYDERDLEVGDLRSATYTNLPPGSYTFRVTACNDDGVWNPTGASLAFSLPARLHERPAVWALGVLLAALGGLGLHRLRLRGLRARYAVVAERNRLASEIHDGLAQGFTGVVLQLGTAERALAASGLEAEAVERVLGPIARARELSRKSLDEARRSVWALRPVVTEGADLPAALRRAADDLASGTAAHVEVRVEGRVPHLDADVEDELAKAAREALANALLHARAGRIVVTLRRKGRRVVVEVTDDGVGFDPSAPAKGYGLVSLRERAARAGAVLSVDSAPGSGTRVRLEAPFRRRLGWRIPRKPA